MEFHYTWTTDGLRLPGMHYAPQVRDICVVFIHGMGGMFIENAFADVLGRSFSTQGYGFIYGHNRGYGQVNDILIKGTSAEPVYRAIGATFERFQECPADVRAWTAFAKAQGYRRIVLLGYSLGGPKVLYSLMQEIPVSLMGVILLSPADMTGLGRQDPHYKEMLREARDNMRQGKTAQLLSYPIWDWYPLSAGTFVDLFEENGIADVLPLHKHPPAMPALQNIRVPMLCLMGEKDDVAIDGVEADLAQIKKYAENCPSVTTEIIPAANHAYFGREEALAETLAGWLKSA